MSMRCCGSSLPSAIVTAAPTQMSATSVAAETAAKTASHTIGSSGLRVTARPSRTKRATQVPSVNCARLKNALKAGISRSKARAIEEPTSPARTSSCAGRNIRPPTSGSSPSESECVLRRKWRCTTQRSAAANPAATTHQGTSRTDGPAPSGSTRVRYVSTVTAATAALRIQILASRPSCRSKPIIRLPVEVGGAPEADPPEAHPCQIDLTAAQESAVAAEAGPAPNGAQRRAAGVAEARTPEARSRPVDLAADWVDEIVRHQTDRRRRVPVERRIGVDHGTSTGDVVELRDEGALDLSGSPHGMLLQQERRRPRHDGRRHRRAARSEVPPVDDAFGAEMREVAIRSQRRHEVSARREHLRLAKAVLCQAAAGPR